MQLARQKRKEGVLLLEHGFGFYLLLHTAPRNSQVYHAIRTEVLFEGDEFATRETIEEHGVEGKGG